jgi:hypothetical protein
MTVKLTVLPLLTTNYGILLSESSSDEIAVLTGEI